MVFGLLLRLLQFALRVYEVALLGYVILPWFIKGSSKVYAFLAKICEPVLMPLRGILARYLPTSWRRFDWSPLAAILLCGIASGLLGLLARVF